MPIINLDFSNVEDNPFGPIPEGPCTLVITSATYLPERNDGTKTKSAGINLICRPDVAPSDSLADKKVYAHLSFGDKSMWKTKEAFEAIFQRPFNSSVPLDTDDLVGLKFVAILGVKDNQYKDKNGVMKTGKANEIKKFEASTDNSFGPSIQ